VSGDQKRPGSARRRRIARPRAAVIGGGLAGLSAAILLARGGWKVTVLERDRRSAVADGDQAFARWERPGVAQFRHSHTFLARLTAILRERLPEVLDLLRARGAIELPLTVATPGGLDLGGRERGDGELVLLGCRRAAFEWALWTVARAEPQVEIREGVLVEGLTARSGSLAGKRVTGVRLRELPPCDADRPRRGIPWRARPDGSAAALDPRGPSTRIAADLVVDASGRRSPARDWLRAIGAGEVHERVVPTGIFYFTRFYRLLNARPPGATTGLIAGDLGWIKLATFPGDSNTFSITVGTGVEDQPLREISDPAAFEALIAAFPEVARWRTRGVSRPIDGPSTPVLVMGGLANRRRSFVREGAPIATGFVVIGDAAYHTNPIYGRGATCALLSAVALADTLRDHPDDLDRAAVAFHERSRREIEPFWVASAAGDRANQARARGDTDLDLARILDLARSPRRALATLIGQAVGVYLEHGVAPAIRTDPMVFRAAMRVMNMLDEPRTALITPSVLLRVLPILAGSLAGQRSPTTLAGPTREQALAILANVKRARTAREAGRTGSTAGSRGRAAPDARIAGHA
jgi:2-polyprenyl-6-methoxyphenol hydroxylase-like FAD-dependent oxidoreductase